MPPCHRQRQSRHASTPSASRGEQRGCRARPCRGGGSFRAPLSSLGRAPRSHTPAGFEGCKEPRPLCLRRIKRGSIKRITCVFFQQQPGCIERILRLSPACCCCYLAIRCPCCSLIFCCSPCLHFRRYRAGVACCFV